MSNLHVAVKACGGLQPNIQLEFDAENMCFNAVKAHGSVQSTPQLPPDTNMSTQQMALMTLPPPAAFFPLSGVYS